MASESKISRRYHATVERSLALFDPSSEWADYIAFLSRLSKAIQTGRPEEATDIPLKASIAKCLSQCLQPHLPAGVHQKALEVYEIIFATLGTEGVARDLSLYLPGLSNTLSFANLSTRPIILGLYEDYILKVQPRFLRPALKALILSLLPVLEEETSEDFERALATLSQLRNQLLKDGHESFFWQTLFVCSISSSNRRLGALVYLTRYLPKLRCSSRSTVTNNGHVGDLDDLSASVNAIIDPEPGLLVRCFATGLQDDQPLVQRGFLDLLVTHLPLDADVFSKSAHTKDVDVLVLAAAMVVLRRDMSLNRRLWAWFTGSESKANNATPTSPLPGTEKQMKIDNYFNNYSLNPLIRSIQTMIATPSQSAPVKAQPFRVTLSLMDKWEIGGPVVHQVFVPLLKSLQTYQGSAPSQDAFDEVFRSANVFFDGVETKLLFDRLLLLLKTDLNLLTFIVESFNLEDSDMVTIHIPALCLETAQRLQQSFPVKDGLLEILNTLLILIPTGTQISNGDSTRPSVKEKLLEAVLNSYLDALSTFRYSASLLTLCSCLERVIILQDDLRAVSTLGFRQRVLSCFENAGLSDDDGFFLSTTIARLLVSLTQQDTKKTALSLDDFSDLNGLVVERLWHFLSPSTPQYHVSCAEDIWRLHDLFPELRMVDSVLARLFELNNNSKDEDRASVMDRFAILWIHSRSIRKFADDSVPSLFIQPILRIVDVLQMSGTDPWASRWVLTLPSATPILNIILVTREKSFQEMSLKMSRVIKFIRLLRSLPNHWSSFATSSDLSKVQDLYLSLLNPQETRDERIIVEALFLAREIHGSEGSVSVPDDLLNLLAARLASNEETNVVQQALLDTILTFVSETRPIPQSLLNVALGAISSSRNDVALDKWITLLCNALPPYSVLLPHLLKITECCCKKIDSAFESLQALFVGATITSGSSHPERCLINLLSGLEYVLARAHQQVSLRLEGEGPGATGTSNDTTPFRAFANDHLTIVLCMQDAAKICAKIWLWRVPVRSAPDVKSLQHMAMRLRSRSRRILENLIEAEPQECLETFISLWVDKQQAQVLELLQTLDGARPKFMMPATFNAIYNRTNPTALDQSQKSSLSIDVAPLDLIAFLSDYTAALEDDLLEEIWADCTTFLREVLANPMPHRQILVKLLEFNAVLCRKIENTNFGEANRMRKELADLSARLFTAIFTINPAGLDQSTTTESESVARIKKTGFKGQQRDLNALDVMRRTLPDLSNVLTSSDRLVGVYNGIALNITSPAIHSRLFPQNMSLEVLELLRVMSTSSLAAKSWRRDISDALNSPKFFSSSSQRLVGQWLPLIRQLALSDKGMMTELLGRLTAPATAGLMFGVGATGARTEADRRTQLEIRRICVLLLSMESDSFVPNLRQIMVKLEELFGATPESSPSLTTRGDLYLLCRTLLFSFSQSQLGPLWPLLDSELREMCTDMLANEQRYSKFSRLQGSKLLDVLLIMRPDEFQLREWLFVTDTIDAVYPPNYIPASSLADLLAPHLPMSHPPLEIQTSASLLTRKPWLCSEESRDLDQSDGLLANFFSQLSIRAFEDIYTMRPIDIEACRQDLLADLFNDQ